MLARIASSVTPGAIRAIGDDQVDGVRAGQRWYAAVDRGIDAIIGFQMATSSTPLRAGSLEAGDASTSDNEASI